MQGEGDAGGGDPSHSRLDFCDADSGDAGTTRTCSRSSLLCGNHLARGDKSTREQEHVVLASARAIDGELLPIKLITDDQATAAAALGISFLEAGIRGHDLGAFICAGAEEKPVVVCWRGIVATGILAAIGGRWWRREGHYVRLVVGMCACGQ